MQETTNAARTMAVLAVLLGVTLLGALALLLTGRGSLSPGGEGGLSATGVTNVFLQAREALRGSPPAFDALDAAVERLETSGDAALSEEQAAIANQVRSSATAIRKGRQDVVAVLGDASEIDKLSLEVGSRLQEIRSAGGAAQPAVLAQLARLRTVMDALPGQVRSLVTGSARPTEIANRLGQVETEVAQIVIGLQGGDPDLGIKALTGPRAGDALNGLSAARERIFARVRDARARADRLDLVNQAGRQLDGVAARLGAAPSGAAAAGADSLRGLAVPGLLVAALLLLAALAWLLFRRVGAASGQDSQAGESGRNQQAILRLLDELSSLADGDLTVQATVNEDITGAIADSINYAIEALRELVTTINESAILLDGAARQADSTGRQLVQASESQSRQVDAASQAIARMAGSIEEVSGDAERSSDVARHSVDVAHKGGDAVRRTIEGMNAIRETIQETSKRIKRLGESSQEIGNIVELINDIADQTNILALNASIQASMAGEAGRGFAVVADEVQRLAERSANATKQIEVLVRTIQADTNEAIVSMERSTTDVVGGALLAENAGAALEEIEQVSNQIASLVQNISGSAREQAGAAAAVIRNVEVLQQINSQAASGTSATTGSIAKLAELAADLRRSVAGFRLPAGGAEAARSRLSGSPRDSAAPEPEASGGREDKPAARIRLVDKKSA